MGFHLMRLNFSAMFHAGVLCVISRSFVLIRYRERAESFYYQVLCLSKYTIYFANPPAGDLLSVTLVHLSIISFCKCNLFKRMYCISDIQFLKTSPSLRICEITLARRKEADLQADRGCESQEYTVSFHKYSILVAAGLFRSLFCFLRVVKFSHESLPLHTSRRLRVSRY